MARHATQPAKDQSRRAGFLKTVLYMVVMGVVCWWLTALAYPLEIKLHIPEAVASKLPGYAFFVGLALGLGIAYSRSMKDIFSALLAMAILGGVGWFLGMLFGGLLIVFGVEEPILSWMPRIGFGVGVLLGSIVLFAIAQDRVDALRARLTGKQH
jgi:MFS family permease